MSVPHLQVTGLIKRFGAVAAVDGVSLDVAAGEFFAILGPSGSGKSTLLRMLAGFEMPDAGRVLLDGVEITATPPHRRPVNMMFQNYALFPHMSVERNVGFGLRQEGLPRAEIATRVEAALALVQLSDKAGRRPHQLSGGERQRVALARALIKRPKLVLLDEPLAALDKRLREETRAQLVQLQREVGVTFVIVTHDQDEAMSLAGRMAVMDSGRVVQIGPPREVYERPASRFVAQFVGDVNLIEARVVDNAAARVTSAIGEIRLHAAPTAPNGATLWIAIRPEKVDITQGGPGGANVNAAQGAVLAAAYLGNVSIYRVRTTSGFDLTAMATNSSRPAAADAGRSGLSVVGAGGRRRSATVIVRARWRACRLSIRFLGRLQLRRIDLDVAVEPRFAAGRRQADRRRDAPVGVEGEAGQQLSLGFDLIGSRRLGAVDPCHREGMSKGYCRGAGSPARRTHAAAGRPRPPLGRVAARLSGASAASIRSRAPSTGISSSNASSSERRRSASR